jgi:transposase-like protein
MNESSIINQNQNQNQNQSINNLNQNNQSINHHPTPILIITRGKMPKVPRINRLSTAAASSRNEEAAAAVEGESSSPAVASSSGNGNGSGSGSGSGNGNGNGGGSGNNSPTVRHAISNTSGSSSNHNSSGDNNNHGSSAALQLQNKTGPEAIMERYQRRMDQMTDEQADESYHRILREKNSAKVRKWRKKLRQSQMSEDEKIAKAREENERLVKEKHELTERLCQLNEAIAEITAIKGI